MWRAGQANINTAGREALLQGVEHLRDRPEAVDEIIEWTLDTTTVDSPLPDARSVIDRGPSPNPFNPATQFRFRLNRPGTYRLRVHDLRGRVLWSSRPTAGSVGEYRVTWNGSRSDGSPLASGIYLYTIALDGKMVSSGKLSLLK